MVKKLRYTREIWIEKAIAVHGDKYDYSKVVYKGSKIKVEIVCKKHGSFFQLPSQHLLGHGCDTCAHEFVTNGNRITPEEFIRRATKVHKGKYKYPKNDFVGVDHDVTFICPVHGEIRQNAGRHLNGADCFACGRIRALKKTAEKLTIPYEERIKRAKETHNNKYEYLPIKNYKTGKSKLKIYCPIHDLIFFQQADAHINTGAGCPKCAIDNMANQHRKTLNDFIEQASNVHNGKYDYSKVTYKNGKTNVVIICQEHGGFKQTPTAHLRGQGCPVCGNILSGEKHTLGTKEFIRRSIEIHGDKYDYSRVDYNKAKIKVEIICNKHQESFWQTPDAHLQGQGCPVCGGSKGEAFVAKWLTEHGFEFTPQVSYPDCRDRNPLRFDFEVQTKNGIVLIEYNGKQHYEPIAYFGGQKQFETNQRRDRIKKAWAKKKGLPLLVIPYNRRVDRALVKYFQL